MINVLKVCRNLCVELCQNYTTPYLRKIKGRVIPIKIWRFGEENDDKIIYFITDISRKASGTFSLYLSMLSEISFAYMMGWVPVIDDTKGLVRKMTWKKKIMMGDFFELGNRLSVRDVLNSKNVIFCRLTNKSYLLKINGREKELYKIRDRDSLFRLGTEELEYWRNLAHKNLFYNVELQPELEEAYRQVIQGKKNVMSVAVREGKMFLDYETRKTSGEHAQPIIEEFIDTVKKFWKIWKCEYIYLSCEALETINEFTEAFGKEKILILNRYRFKLDELKKIRTLRTGRNFFKKTDKIENYDTDYLKDMYILSKGNFLICPINCGTEAAFIMSDGFQDYHIIETD